MGSASSGTRTDPDRRSGQREAEAAASSGPPSAPAPPGGSPPQVTVTVGAEVTGELPRPWEHMIGGGQLSALLRRDRTGGRVIGDDLQDALRIARDELGIRAVRGHGILSDELGVYRDVDGAPVHSFGGVDQVCDQLLRLGLRLVAGLSFMPRDLASDPGRTLGAGTSPPRDWERWAGLIRDLVAHWTGRYGLAEVRDHWSFEIGNEPGRELSWSGTQEDYFRLYDETARAVRAVDAELEVGGPACAAGEWVDGLLAHLAGSGAPLDFLSVHASASLPADLRPLLARHGRAGTAVRWSGWGPASAQPGGDGDSVSAAAFLLRGMRPELGRAEALCHWAASDHSGTPGSARELFHGGQGVLSVGNLRKPRFWALALLARLGPGALPVGIDGDGAWTMVETLATRADDGRITVLAWNCVPDQQHPDGDGRLARLARQVRLRVRVPAGAPYTVTHYRIDSGHSNIVAPWERLRNGANWPDDGQWQFLKQANLLEKLGPTVTRTPADGELAFDFSLPMPAVSCLELTPQAAGGPG